MLTFEHLTMDYNVAFGSAFKRLRAIKGMTQEDFASVVSERYVRMLEKGEYAPSLTTVLDLARVLGVSPITLVGMMHAAHTGVDLETLMQVAAKEIRSLS
jgi:transcriptional regulator with XRE-family HTH domain